MTKQKKLLVKQLPEKCVFCGSQKSKRNDDASRQQLRPNGLLMVSGPVLCVKCDATYQQTEFYKFEEVKSGQRKSGSAGVRQKNGDIPQE